MSRPYNTIAPLSHNVPAEPQPLWKPLLLGAALGSFVGALAATITATSQAPVSALYAPAPAAARVAAHRAPTARYMGDKVQHMVDIGARDPYAAELATDFGNRQVGGHADTGHNVKIPETSVLGLAAREITPLPADAKALDEPAANKLKRAAGPGLILEVEGDALRATQQWTTAGAEQSEELSRRLVALGEELGHPLEVRIEGDRVTGVFWTPAVNGLTENDFILAAKVNNADFKDLLKKRKRRVFA